MMKTGLALIAFALTLGGSAFAAELNPPRERVVEPVPDYIVATPTVMSQLPTRLPSFATQTGLPEIATMTTDVESVDTFVVPIERDGKDLTLIQTPNGIYIRAETRPTARISVQDQHETPDPQISVGAVAVTD